MRKIQIYRAVDRIDGALSWFAIESVGGKDVRYTTNTGHIISEAGFIERVERRIDIHGALTWDDHVCSPRRGDMIKPTLIKEWEVK